MVSLLVRSVPFRSFAGVIRGAYTCAVQAYLTFSICKLLTFSGLKCAISLYFAQTLLRNAKLFRGYQSHRNFAFNTRGALKLRRFSSPDLASLKCYAFLRPTPNGLRPLGGWGKRTDNISDYDLHTYIHTYFIENPFNRAFQSQC